MNDSKRMTKRECFNFSITLFSHSSFSACTPLDRSATISFHFTLLSGTESNCIMCTTMVPTLSQIFPFFFPSQVKIRHVTKYCNKFQQIHCRKHHVCYAILKIHILNIKNKFIIKICNFLVAISNIRISQISRCVNARCDSQITHSKLLQNNILTNYSASVIEG